MRLHEYATHDATALAALVAEGEVTAGELTALATEAAKTVNQELNAIIELYDTPSSVDGEGRLRGVPTLRKDLAPEAGRLNELGSLLAAGHRARTTSSIVERTLRAGATIIGRTATPELGFHSATESVLHGVTRNPWDLERTPGGSSGGSAAAVAAGVVPLALASDGGGSIRIPASCCGLVGLKPSRGRISPDWGTSEPLFGMAVDHVVTRTVRDAVLALDILGTPHPDDPLAVIPGDAALGALRVVLSTEAWAPCSSVDPEVVAATTAVAATLEQLGHHVRAGRPQYTVDAAWDAAWDAALTFYGIYGKSAVDDLATATGRPVDTEHLEPTTLAYYEAGSRLTALDVAKAVERKALVCWELESFFRDMDLLVTPTLPNLPRPHETANPTAPTAREHWVLMEDIHPNLSLFNLTGHPALSLPLGMSESGVPIGVQLVAARGRDDLLLTIAAALEEAMPWADRRPPVHVLHRIWHAAT